MLHSCAAFLTPSSSKRRQLNAFSDFATTYNDWIVASPLLTKSVTSGVILGLADATTQLIESRQRKKAPVKSESIPLVTEDVEKTSDKIQQFSFVRVARFSSLGLLLIAPWVSATNEERKTEERSERRKRGAEEMVVQCARCARNSSCGGSLFEHPQGQPQANCERSEHFICSIPLLLDAPLLPDPQLTHFNNAESLLLQSAGRGHPTHRRSGLRYEFIEGCHRPRSSVSVLHRFHNPLSQPARHPVR